MSAAATAAGYLYASGRLRNRQRLTNTFPTRKSEPNGTRFTYLRGKDRQAPGREVQVETKGATSRGGRVSTQARISGEGEVL